MYSLFLHNTNNQYDFLGKLIGLNHKSWTISKVRNIKDEI